VVHDGQSVGDVGRYVAGPEFPDEMVADLDDGPGPANVFRSYPVEFKSRFDVKQSKSKLNDYRKWNTNRWG
jgi:hypothetical protein